MFSSTESNKKKKACEIKCFARIDNEGTQIYLWSTGCILFHLNGKERTISATLKGSSQVLLRGILGRGLPGVILSVLTVDTV